MSAFFKWTLLHLDSFKSLLADFLISEISITQLLPVDSYMLFEKLQVCRQLVLHFSKEAFRKGDSNLSTL